MVSLEKSALEKPLMQALAISDGKYGGVQVKFNGGIDLVFNNPDRGTYQKVSIPLKGKNYTMKKRHRPEHAMPLSWKR